jgi:hypothetical protein
LYNAELRAPKERDRMAEEVFKTGPLKGVAVDDAFARAALQQSPVKPFPPGTPSATIIDTLKATAGTIYGIYQYCTTLNSAFACWGIIAGM